MFAQLKLRISLVLSPLVFSVWALHIHHSYCSSFLFTLLRQFGNQPCHRRTRIFKIFFLRSLFGWRQVISIPPFRGMLSWKLRRKNKENMLSWVFPTSNIMQASFEASYFYLFFSKLLWASYSASRRNVFRFVFLNHFVRLRNDECSLLSSARSLSQTPTSRSTSSLARGLRRAWIIKMTRALAVQSDQIPWCSHIG